MTVVVRVWVRAHLQGKVFSLISFVGPYQDVENTHVWSRSRWHEGTISPPPRLRCFSVRPAFYWCTMLANHSTGVVVLLSMLAKPLAAAASLFCSHLKRLQIAAVCFFTPPPPLPAARTPAMPAFRTNTCHASRRPAPLDAKPPRAETSPTRSSSLGIRAKSAANLPATGGAAPTAATAGAATTGTTAADRASRGGSTTGSLTGVDLEEELEHVHMELRSFLNKKRARKAGGGGLGILGGEGLPGSAARDGQVRGTFGRCLCVLWCRNESLKSIWRVWLKRGRIWLVRALWFGL